MYSGRLPSRVCGVRVRVCVRVCVRVLWRSLLGSGESGESGAGVGYRGVRLEQRTDVRGCGRGRANCAKRSGPIFSHCATPYWSS